jgi:N-acetylneuraminic acid mutarotase
MVHRLAVALLFLVLGAGSALSCNDGYSCGCSGEVVDLNITGPSCPLGLPSPDGGLPVLAGVSSACVACLDAPANGGSSVEYDYSSSADVDSFWSCFCACDSSGCRRQCNSELAAGSGEALDVALHGCVDACAGQDIVAVVIPTDAAPPDGSVPTVCVGSTYTSVADNACGCAGGASYGICVNGSYDCACNIPPGYTKAAMCLSGAADSGGPPRTGVLLFGGVGAGTANELADSWLWNGATWTELPVFGPDARDSASMAAANGTAVLFGGEDVNTNSFDDTWVWDGSCWSESDPRTPAARSSASMATWNDAVVMFGGSDVSGAFAPESLEGYPGYTVITDTDDGEDAGVDDLLRDTWLWSGRDWTEQRGSEPASRDGAAMATLNDTVVLFGGEGDENPFDDTWTWDRNGWKKLEATGPRARYGASMAALSDRIVLFGGVDTNGDSLDDTWTWDGTAWQEEKGGGPIARSQATMASLNGTVVLFGGLNSDQEIMADTWTWDGASWKRLHVAGPPARLGAAMATLGNTRVGVGQVDAGVDAHGDARTDATMDAHVEAGTDARVDASAADSSASTRDSGTGIDAAGPG